MEYAICEPFPANLWSWLKLGFIDLANNEGIGDFQVFMQRRFGVVYSECSSSRV